MITLHQYHLSPFNEKIQRQLNCKGIAFTQKYWRLGDRKKVTDFNPTGKLPALEHDGRLIADSTDIAWYIEETFPQHPLVPTDPGLRGQVHILEDWADESLYFYEMCWRFNTEGNRQRNIPRMVEHETPFLRWFLGKVIPGGLKKILDSQGIGRKTVEQLAVDTRRHVRALENLLHDSDWLVGQHISLADLAVYAMFQCLRDASESAQILVESSPVSAWMERVEQHSSQRAATGDQ